MTGAIFILVRELGTLWGVIQKLPFSHTKNVTAEEIKRLKKWPETTSNDFHARAEPIRDFNSVTDIANLDKRVS